MLRSSKVYRRLWYVKRRNIGRFHMIKKVAAVIIILLLTVYYAGISVLAFVQDSPKTEFKKVAVQTVYDAHSILKSWDASDGYDGVFLQDLVSGDEEKFMQEELCARISAMLEKRLASARYKTLEVPLGVFTGIKALYDVGPGIQVRLDYEDIKVSYEKKHEYDENGIPQDKLIVYIKAYVKAMMPLLQTERPVVLGIVIDPLSAGG